MTMSLTNGKGQHFANFLFAETGKVGLFKKIDYTATNGSSVRNLLEKEAVLLDAWNSKRIHLGTHGHDEAIIGNDNFCNLALVFLALYTLACDRLALDVN
jgi:hypothetical protein